MTEKKLNSITYAKHEPLTCLTPNLFKSLKRGDKKRLKLDIRWNIDKNRHLEFAGPEPLGAEELRLLQGLVALAGPKSLLLKPNPKTKIGKELREKMEFKYDAKKSDAVMIKSSFAELMKIIGYNNTKNYKMIRDTLERLWKVSIILQENNKRFGFHILSFYASEDEEYGRLQVALNPMIAKIMLFIGRRYVYIDMNEVKKIKNDATRILHQRLCAFIDFEKSVRIKIDKLCDYVYNKTENKEAQKKQYQQIRKALNELKNLGWKIDEYAQNSFKITRPKMPSEQ